jgi:hypothetical protein
MFLSLPRTPGFKPNRCSKSSTSRKLKRQLVDSVKPDTHYAKTVLVPIVMKPYTPGGMSDALNAQILSMSGLGPGNTICKIFLPNL